MLVAMLCVLCTWYCCGRGTSTKAVGESVGSGIGKIAKEAVQSEQKEEIDAKFEELSTEKNISATEKKSITKEKAVAVEEKNEPTEEGIWDDENKRLSVEQSEWSKETGVPDAILFDFNIQYDANYNFSESSSYEYIEPTLYSVKSLDSNFKHMIEIGTLDAGAEYWEFSAEKLDKVKDRIEEAAPKYLAFHLFGYPDSDALRMQIFFYDDENQVGLFTVLRDENGELVATYDDTVRQVVLF